MPVVLSSNLDDLKLVARGKVRDIYATSVPDALLFVATDRISAYDVILNNGIPNKGRLLTQWSLFWFDRLKSILPNHLITSELKDMPEEIRAHGELLDGRVMLVRKARVIPLEAIVRGYLTGSAWSEYQKHGTVHGIRVEPGLIESSKLQEPLFTPSTKAEQGAHDENIHPDKARIIVGAEVYNRVEAAALQLYKTAASHALARGVILADTKFEFGIVGEDELILIDEVLTPDSSRYWPAVGYEPGRPQPSFDKQYIRNWLVENGFRKGLESGVDGKGWSLSPEVVEGTLKRYEEAYEMITGQRLG